MSRGTCPSTDVPAIEYHQRDPSQRSGFVTVSPAVCLFTGRKRAYVFNQTHSVKHYWDSTICVFVKISPYMELQLSERCVRNAGEILTASLITMCAGFAGTHRGFGTAHQTHSQYIIGTLRKKKTDPLCRMLLLQSVQL